MKKYIITSSAFQGSVDVWYNEHGCLQYLNFGRYYGTAALQQAIVHLIPLKMYNTRQPLTLANLKVEEV